MLPAFLLLILTPLFEANAERETPSWPLFEFWNPLTWLNPKFSSETLIQMLRANRDSNRKVYLQLRKALLPSNLFLGNIKAQYEAWDSGKEKKPLNSHSRPYNKKETKKPSNQKPRKN